MRKTTAKGNIVNYILTVAIILLMTMSIVSFTTTSVSAQTIGCGEMSECVFAER